MLRNVLKTNYPEGIGMKKNMGTIDRTIRFLLAVVVGALYFTGQITGLATIVLGVIAAAFVLTSSVGFCPLYAPFGWSTGSRSGATSA